MYLFFVKKYTTYTKHSGWYNSPFEFIILALGSKPRPQREQVMLSMLTILKI